MLEYRSDIFDSGFCAAVLSAALGCRRQTSAGMPGARSAPIGAAPRRYRCRIGLAKLVAPDIAEAEP